MANDKNFVIKNGLQAGRYLQTGGAETVGSEGYNLAGASYDSVSFSVASQDTTPVGLAFKPDGTKMYMLGLGGDTVFQYTLSTAFDLSTASYDSVSVSITQDTGPYSLAFNSDGTKMYVLGNTSGTVYQYNLSTAYDLSTTSYIGVSFSVTGQDSSPLGLAFNNNGTKMYIAGNANDSIFQYSLSTAFDLSTASYDSVSLDVGGQDIAPLDLTFNGDGTKMYFIGTGNDSIFQYSLSTAFDLSTALYDNISFDLTGQDSAPSACAFNSDGTKIYVAGQTNDTIYQYSTVGYTQTLDLSTGTYFSFTPSGATTVSFTNAPASGKAIGFSVEIVGDGSAITWPSSVKWSGGVAPVASASKELYALVTTDGGTTYYGRKAAEELA